MAATAAALEASAAAEYQLCLAPQVPPLARAGLLLEPRMAQPLPQGVRLMGRCLHLAALALGQMVRQGPLQGRCPTEAT